MLCAVVVLLARAPLSNPDTFFHLRYGHEFLADWTIRDPGSVNSFATNDWAPTQWASQVTMAKFEDWFGLGGVAWLAGLLLLAYAVALYASCRQGSIAAVAMPLAALAFLASGPGLSARPQVVSYLLMSVTVAAWLRTSDDGRLRWWLVPATWAWASLHGLWFVGVGTSVVAALACVASSRATGRSRWAPLLVPALCAIAAAATPLGPRAYAAVLRVRDQAAYYSEFDPPNLTHLPVTVLFLMLAVTVALAVRSPSPVSPVELGLLLLAMALAAYSLRTVPMAAALVAPLLALQVQRRLASRTPVPRAEHAAVAGAALVTLVVLALVAPAAPGGALTRVTWLDERLGALPAGTPLLDEDTWGGYLMWRFPELDLVAHGYADSYTLPELDRLVMLQSLQPGWDAELDRLGVELALLRPTSPLAYALQHDLGWLVVESSDEALMLRAP
ncbi:MAG: hypothetical protein Q7J48_10025 [Nocardioides sp.]|nr:hypothetical protein [Nocardioides sp.]